MHDKVVRSEYSDIWHVLWPGFEITTNNTKKHHQENTKMDRKQCTFLLVCVNNLSFHCAFWCNKQYFFQLSKQCVWLRAIGTLSSQDEFVDDDERKRVRSGSRTSSKAGKTNV